MNNITEWLKIELYPTLFNSIDVAFPEHNFKPHYGGWRSNTYLDGSPHTRVDKTVITNKAPGLILEQGGEVKGLVDYVMIKDKVDFIQAVKTLAEVVNLQLPKSDFNEESYQRHKDKSTLLEECNSYFNYSLEHTTRAEEMRGYLSSRGYSDADVKDMELGYIPAQIELKKYLISKGYSSILIDEVVKLNEGIGLTHKLTIPYRSGGSLKGFKFRTIGDATPKYLNSTGLDRNGGFFNLLGIKGDKDVVIVEGELDSLHATIKGVDNVVATGGSSVNAEQIRDAKKRGAKSFTLCFDMEPGKEEETNKKLSSAIDVILGEGISRVYIATLPDLGGGKTDPDRLIKESGVDSFKTAISQALTYYEYRLQNTLEKYLKIDEEIGGLTAKEIHKLEDEVVATSYSISDSIDRDLYKKSFLSHPIAQALGISEESLTSTVERLTSTRDKEAQSKEFKKLLSEVTQLQDKGEIGKALEMLENKVKEVKLQDKKTEFSSLLLPIKENDLRERISRKPDSLDSGYRIGGESLLLPAGAITILAAPTSHGKTTLLLNTALNVAQRKDSKETYFFSYEEDSDTVLISALNIYLDTNISGNNRTTITNYFKGENSKFIDKDKFFNELIDTRKLNIHYSNYDSDTLIDAIRYLHKNTNVGSIFIDYIQLLNLPQGKYKTYSRQEEMKEVCIALKDVAVETGLPIILGAQFNRTVTNLTHLHPTRIGEAGDIERIANLIVGFWNNNFKSIASEGEQKEINAKGECRKETIYATILKQRGGKIGGEEILDFNGNHGKIKNEIIQDSRRVFMS